MFVTRISFFSRTTSIWKNKDLGNKRKLEENIKKVKRCLSKRDVFH